MEVLVVGVWSLRARWECLELVVQTDRTEQARPSIRPADRRGVIEDRQIDRLPVPLRQRLASTAEQVAATFALGAQVRERIGAGSGANVDYYRLRAAWNRTVADFERRQADALRGGGHLLAVPWWPVANSTHDGRPIAGQP
jgi:hypothetical protein